VTFLTQAGLLKLFAELLKGIDLLMNHI